GLPVPQPFVPTPSSDPNREITFHDGLLPPPLPARMHPVLDDLAALRIAPASLAGGEPSLGALSPAGPPPTGIAAIDPSTHLVDDEPPDFRARSAGALVAIAIAVLVGAAVAAAWAGGLVPGAPAA